MKKRQPAIYDSIGNNYNHTRKADPYITDRLYHLLTPQADKLYIDIGCGTGNYINALTERGLSFIGVDPSDTMLKVAKQQNPNIEFLNSRVEKLPFNDTYFDGAITTFTLHHWENVEIGLREINRILKPGAQFVMLSFTPEQMDRYWLRHYFPEMIKRSGEQVPDKDTQKQMLIDAGFSTVKKEKYFIHDGLTDNFLFSNKYKPEQYLDPTVRNGISSFRLFASDQELKNGVKQLEADISSGFIRSIIENYENDLGDYLFYCATK